MEPGGVTYVTPIVILIHTVIPTRTIIPTHTVMPTQVGIQRGDEGTEGTALACILVFL